MSVKLDLRECVQHPNLFACENMFAQKVDTLQGQTLCQFLAEMDAQEYTIILKENITYSDGTVLDGNMMAQIGITGGGGGTLGGMLGVALQSLFFAASFFSVGALFFGWIAYSGLTGQKQLKVAIVMSHNRLNRLDQKIRTINERIATLRQNIAQEQEQIQQLETAKEKTILNKSNTVFLGGMKSVLRTGYRHVGTFLNSLMAAVGVSKALFAVKNYQVCQLNELDEITQKIDKFKQSIFINKNEIEQLAVVSNYFTIKSHHYLSEIRVKAT